MAAPAIQIDGEIPSSQQYTKSGSIADLCELFSSTVSSMSSDITTLRQIASIHCVLENETEGNENSDPNFASGIQQNTQNDLTSVEIKRNLCRIDETISALEEKANALREVIAKESLALLDLEEVKAAAEEQNKAIERVFKRLERFWGDESNINQPPLTLETACTSSIPKKSLSKKSSNCPQMPRHLSQTAASSRSLHLPLISEAEFMTVSKQIRGRVSLAVTNDALKSIEMVCREKYVIIGLISPYASEAERQDTQQQQTLQYRQCIAAHTELEVEEHSGYFWISEQDLRNSCAFFHIGESTARAILATLRSLKRLKQVCGQHLQVTYILLV